MPAKSTLTRSGNNEKMSKEELRKRHQFELARQKSEETVRRLVACGGGGRPGETLMTAYKSVGEVPCSKELEIQVDKKNDAILLPICGSMVAFHISTVKSVTSSQDNHASTVRITFNVPTASGTGALKGPAAAGGGAVVYLKEATFRSKDARHSNEMAAQIKKLRRVAASRESGRAERASLVAQEKLRLSPGMMKKPQIRLPGLEIQPAAFWGGGSTRKKRLSGTLEAHENGFRYSTSGPGQQRVVDILFNNIKHAFFQPAEGREMTTLLHFRLHNHIMVGEKKALDVQFYVEVTGAVQTVGGGGAAAGRRYRYDPDEIKEEQRERERRNKINMDFLDFVNKVHRQPLFRDLGLEFDRPLRELGFDGVPYKSSVFIAPTSSGCLVHLSEAPFVVISLSEVEIVSLERAALSGSKSFDMAFVFKDFNRDVFRVDSIRSTSLSAIKEWLDSTNTKYYESTLNIIWKPLLKSITDDPEGFLKEGGWEILNVEAPSNYSGSGEESAGSDDEESDQGYEPSAMELEEEEEDDDDDDDDDDESVVESDEESEEEHSEADREREDDDDTDSEEERSRKTEASGKSRVPDRRRDTKGSTPPPPPPKRRRGQS